MKSELEIKEGIVKTLLCGNNKNPLSASLVSLQETVKDRFVAVNGLVMREEERLRSLSVERNSCMQEIEDFCHWLRNVINEFPDMEKEFMEENLSLSRIIVTSIEAKFSSLDSLLENAQRISKDLPAGDKNSLDRKARELKGYFEEIKKQGEDYIRDLEEKTNEKLEVRMIFFINLL